MKVHAPVLAALAAFTFGNVGAAQVVHDTPQPLPPAAPAPAPEPESLSVPDLPAVSPELAARVEALGRTVQQTSECYTEHGERSEHAADPRCPQWYASLLRGGAAAAHAIGRAMEAVPDANNYDLRVRGGAGESERGPRLMQILAAADPNLAVRYMLRYVAVSSAPESGGFGDTDDEALRQLARLTGYNLTPSVPWEPSPFAHGVARTAATNTWLRWWRDHQGEAPAAWRAHGEQRALADLTHDDPAVRFTAMQRLAGIAAHRGAVQAALHDVLRRDDLPARARVAIRRWASRARLPLPPIAAPANVGALAAR